MDGIEAKFIEPTVSGRLKLVLCVLAAIGLDVVMDRWWDPFMTFLRSLPLCELLPWHRALFLGFVALFWTAGASVARAAWLTLRAGQSPLPGAWVWVRTEVRTGWKATLDGYVLVLLAFFSIVGPVVVGYLLKVHLIFCWPASCGC